MDRPRLTIGDIELDVVAWENFKLTVTHGLNAVMEAHKAMREQLKKGIELEFHSRVAPEELRGLLEDRKPRKPPKSTRWYDRFREWRPWVQKYNHAWVEMLRKPRRCPTKEKAGRPYTARPALKMRSLF